MPMHFVAAAAAVKPSADVNSDGEIGDKGRIWLNLPFHLTPSEGKRTFMIGEVGKIGEGGCRRHLCQTFEPVLCKRYKLFYNLGAVQMMMLLLLLLLL